MKLNLSTLKEIIKESVNRALKEDPVFTAQSQQDFDDQMERGESFSTEDKAKTEELKSIVTDLINGLNNGIVPKALTNFIDTFKKIVESDEVPMLEPLLNELQELDDLLDMVLDAGVLKDIIEPLKQASSLLKEIFTYFEGSL